MKSRNIKKLGYLMMITGITYAITLTSCNKYVDAGPSKTQMTPDKVFTDSVATLGSVLSLYGYIPSYSSWVQNISEYGAMSADDAYYFNKSAYDPYRTNTLNAGSILATIMYNNTFQQIYFANANIEGITASNTLSTSFKNQMIGECLFWRAYAYFYLVNYWGDVPIVTTTDVNANAVLSRSPVAEVYKQIVTDLLKSKDLVSVAYPSAEKARVNKAVVSALLARVYLYQKNWLGAETEATSIISSETYQLEANLNNVFLSNSKETIWQTVSTNSNSIHGITKMGQSWIPTGTVPVFVLYDELVNAFEPGDKRLESWTKPLVYNGKTYYYPYKYKIRVTTAPGNEYNVMFRLSEQYLIRSEARAQQDNFSGAEKDLDEIRDRAGLENEHITLTDKTSAMTALEHERWVELFTEMGDRWFNLKRTGRADAVLKLVKPDWKPFQALYPIYTGDIKMDPNITQNPGY